MPKPLFIALLILVPVTLSGIAGPVGFLLGLALILGGNPIIWNVRKNRYFRSDEFQALRKDAAAVVQEHNEVVDYVEEIRARGSFELGASPSGQYANLASFENNSAWNNRRDRNIAEYAPHVHNAGSSS